MKCPKCGSSSITRKIIGAEMETVCLNCGFYDDSQQFKQNKKELKDKNNPPD